MLYKIDPTSISITIKESTELSASFLLDAFDFEQKGKDCLGEQSYAHKPVGTGVPDCPFSPLFMRTVEDACPYKLDWHYYTYNQSFIFLKM